MNLRMRPRSIRALLVGYDSASASRAADTLRHAVSEPLDLTITHTQAQARARLAAGEMFDIAFVDLPEDNGISLAEFMTPLVQHVVFLAKTPAACPARPIIAKDQAFAARTRSWVALAQMGILAAVLSLTAQ